MLIYSSPKSGKTSICNDNTKWIDGDKILFKILQDAFSIEIRDDDTKGEQIINLFKINRVRAEKCYTAYMNWLKEANYDNNILIGSRRFMWLCDCFIIKVKPDSDIYLQEIKSLRKWNIGYNTIKENEFINLKMLKDYEKTYHSVP